MDEEPINKKRKLNCDSNSDVAFTIVSSNINEKKNTELCYVEVPTCNNSSENNKETGKVITVISSNESSQKYNDNNNDKLSNEIESVGNICNEAEVKVGIRLQINQIKRFSGIIKQRFSDFVVRECDLKGNLVHLTSLDHIDNKEKVEECPIKDEELLKRIEIFVKSDDKSEKMNLDSDNDKEHRKIVHKYIKETYKHIETGTVTLANGDQAVQLSFKSKTANHYERNNRNKQYCNFVLFKQGKDTIACVNMIASKIHKPANLFTYAGTKDRRATTVQRLSVKHATSKQLAGLNNFLNSKNIALGNFYYSKDGMKLGDLSGNQFIIVIRNVLCVPEDVEKCCNSLKSKGFINYFGLQRFGTGVVPTSDIGKALLLQKFEDVVNMILTTYSDDDKKDYDSEREAKKIWTESKNAKLAFSSAYNRNSIEGKLLSALCKNSEQNSEKQNIHRMKSAYFSLPRNIRLLYLHSYQSLVWNNAVSKRIEQHGMKPHIGDLVLLPQKDKKGFEQVHVLTSDDVSSKTYSIYDIVLPLPGFDMVYPENLHAFYKEQLAKDGLDLDNLKNNKDKDLSLSGKYRKIIVLPNEMSWSLFRYDDYTISVIKNDLEMLKKEDGGDQSREMGETKETTNGKFQGMKLAMTLQSSSYATSALREILVDDSSYQSQVKLNNQAKGNTAMEQDLNPKMEE